MKEKFKYIFTQSLRVINWLESPGFLKTRAGDILVATCIGVGCVLYLKDDSIFLNNILIGLLIITMFSLFFVLSLRFYWIKPPKCIMKDTNNPAELFNRFSHWSFLYGIVIYSFFTSLFFIAVLAGIVNMIPNLTVDFSNLFFNLFFITTSLFSIFYFMYHVSVKGIETKLVKVRLNFYLAISATVSAGLFGLSLKEILLPLITYLGLGFAWLSYFLERVESEE